MASVIQPILTLAVRMPVIPPEGLKHRSWQIMPADNNEVRMPVIPRR